ncbi:MAG: MarR family transcriptional regulator [Propionicimonas sp.]
MVRTSDQPTRVSRVVELVDRYSRDLTKVTHTVIGPSGIANRDLNLLLTISRNPGVRPSALSDQLKISRALVSQALRRFESDGLIGRSIDSADHRSWHLSTTARGRARVQAFEAELATWFVQESPKVREMHVLLNRTLTLESAESLAPLDAIQALTVAGTPYVSELESRLLPFGRLTATHRSVLTLVDAFGPQRPVQLASELSLTSGGISGVLDHLEHFALVVRRRSSTGADRKAVQVALSPTGERAVAIWGEVFTGHSDQILRVLAQTVRVSAPLEVGMPAAASAAQAAS